MIYKAALVMTGFAFANANSQTPEPATKQVFSPTNPIHKNTLAGQHPIEVKQAWEDLGVTSDKHLRETAQQSNALTNQASRQLTSSSVTTHSVQFPGSSYVEPSVIAATTSPDGTRNVVTAGRVDKGGSNSFVSREGASDWSYSFNPYGVVVDSQATTNGQVAIFHKESGNQNSPTVSIINADGSTASSQSFRADVHNQYTIPNSLSIKSDGTQIVTADNYLTMVISEHNLISGTTTGTGFTHDGPYNQYGEGSGILAYMMGGRVTDIDTDELCVAFQTSLTSGGDRTCGTFRLDLARDFLYSPQLLATDNDCLITDVFVNPNGECASVAISGNTVLMGSQALDGSFNPSREFTFQNTPRHAKIHPNTDGTSTLMVGYDGGTTVYNLDAMGNTNWEQAQIPTDGIDMDVAADGTIYVIGANHDITNSQQTGTSVVALTHNGTIEGCGTAPTTNPTHGKTILQGAEGYNVTISSPVITVTNESPTLTSLPKTIDESCDASEYGPGSESESDDNGSGYNWDTFASGATVVGAQEVLTAGALYLAYRKQQALKNAEENNSDAGESKSPTGTDSSNDSPLRPAEASVPSAPPVVTAYAVDTGKGNPRQVGPSYTALQLGENI
jgi:hypothetical protein